MKANSDSDVGCKLWVNAHDKTDYNSICSKERGQKLGSCQLRPVGNFIFANTFENISFYDSTSNQISFNTFICIDHGSLKEALIMNDSVVIIDSIGD